MDITTKMEKLTPLNMTTTILLILKVEVVAAAAATERVELVEVLVVVVLEDGLPLDKTVTTTAAPIGHAAFPN